MRATSKSAHSPLRARHGTVDHGKRGGRTWLISVLLPLLVGAADFLGADVVITEIHYAPVDETRTPRQDLEFVELFNDGPEPYDLYGLRFTRGITYTFHQRIILGARSRLVVCKNVSAARSVYGLGSNAVGNFQGVLDNSGETIELANAQGVPISTVRYNDRGKWPAGAKATGHSLSLVNEYTDPGEPENWALSTSFGGTPGQRNFQVSSGTGYEDSVLIEVGQTWRYFKGRSEPSSPQSAWRQVGFADGSWLTGPTGIGYGDGDDATVLSDMEDSYRTIYCRKTFSVSDPDAVESLLLTITYDDGFFAYLNGTQVTSRNVSGRNFDDDADRAGEPTTEEIDISEYKGQLVEGTNVLAVQVHNAGLGSSDLSFIPRLVSRRTVSSGESVVINEGLFYTSGARFVEIYNPGGSSVDLSGYFLSNDFLDLARFEIPEGTRVADRSYVVFTEAETGLDLSVTGTPGERVSIVLSNPLATRVVDAVIFEPSVPERSEARLPDGGVEFAPAADPTPGSANSVTVITDVVFNEIMYNPVSRDDRDEFLEFYNRRSAPVGIGGWRVAGVDFVFPPGTVINGLSYLVIAKDPARTRARYGLSEAQVVDVPYNGVLKNGGERLELLDANGNVADTVRYYDGGDWPRWADGLCHSLELIDPWSDNDSGLSWDASDDSGEALEVTVRVAGVPYGGRESDLGILLADEGIAVIDDVTLTRRGSSTNLVSNSTFDSSTSGWRIEGTHSRSGRTTNAAERLRGGGSLKLICYNGGGDYKVNRIETDTAQQTSGYYDISFRARWLGGCPRILTIGDYSTSRPENPGFGGSGLISVPATLGSPGAENSVTARQIARTGSADIGPAIDGVSHSPGVPQAGEGVTVVARVRDPDGVGSVSIRYRTDSPSGSFASRAMSDGDGDGIYTGTIPGQSLGTRVLFYIEATDGNERRSRYPRDLFERTNAPVVNPASPGSNEHLYLMYRHDQRLIPTSHHSIRFILNSESENYLRTRRVLSNEMLEGTLVFGSSDVYYNSRIRFAGSPWLRPNGGSSGWARSYGVKLPRDNPLHGRRRGFNLDEHGADGRERLSHYLLRMNAGGTRLPYSDTQALVRFQLNGVYTNTFELLAKPDREFINAWFPDGDRGRLFEMDDRFEFDDGGSKRGNAEGHVRYPPYGSTAGGSNKENYRWYFVPRGGGNRIFDDFTGLQLLCRLMDPDMTRNDTFDDTISNMVDVEELLRVWAIDLNIDNWDTWAGRRGKNCYLYQSSDDLLWRKIPFDLELTYGSESATSMIGSYASEYPNHFEEIQRMINRPRIKRLYCGILAEMVDPATGFFQSSFLQPYLQQVAAAGVNNLGHGMAGGFIDNRASRIRGWIASALSDAIELRITTNGGAKFTSMAPRVNLVGTAPLDIFSLAVARNGEFLDDGEILIEFSSSNELGWSASGVPIGPGTSTIKLFGFDSRGSLVDTAEIQVVSGLNWGQPTVESVLPGQAAPEDQIVLEGENFHDDVQVFFSGDLRATDVLFDEGTNPTEISAVVPAALPPGEHMVYVRNIDGQESDPFPITVLPPAPKFVRGDADMDTIVALNDAVKTLAYLFSSTPVDCLDALDADDSGVVELTDAVVVLDHLFRGRPSLPAPYPNIGADPSREDPLDCEGGF